MPALSFASRFVLCLFLCASSIALGADGQSPRERELLAILRSDAPAAEKAVTCKHLAVHGSPDSVPDLAKLLADEQLASWARIPLEAIPGPEADEALRTAAGSLTGPLLVGTLNSIGVRRDASAVEILAGRLADSETEVASAAAVALGRIATPAAVASLRSGLTQPTSPAVGSAVAEGLILAAEHLAAAGKPTEAVDLYHAVRGSSAPPQRKLEATRGAILTSGEAEGIALLVEQLRSEDRRSFQLGLGIAREFPGRQIDTALAGELTKLPPPRAALLLSAMADRPETIDLAAVLSVAQSGAKPVRLAALAAIRRAGNDACLPSLLEIAVEEDAELVQAAQEALAELPGAGVDAAIISRLTQPEARTYPVLLAAVAQRRIPAVDEVLKGVDHSDKQVRAAAWNALGAIVDLERLPVLIGQVVRPKDTDSATAALAALKVASVRMPDREACAELLASALGKAPANAKGPLLESLAAVGGTRSLEAVAAAAKGRDADQKDLASRLLGEWMTDDAAPVLLDLAKTGPADKYQVRALRGYIRIARQFVLPEDRRMEMCRLALEVARAPAEKKLVLEVLKRYPSVAGLKLAIAAGKSTDLADDSGAAVVAIVQKLGGKSAEVRQLLSQIDLAKVELEIVKATYGAGAQQKDVTEVLRRQVDQLPLLTLPSDNYNAAFGGDPAPGTPKQLKVQYKLNGKAGEATFAENAVIILPTPK